MKLNNWYFWIINQFTIQPKVNENIEIISNESINTINEEKETVNVKKWNSKI